MRFGNECGDVQTLELITLRRADTAGPEQQKIRFEAEQLFHVQLTIAANRRHPGYGRRALASIQHADQQVGGIQLNDDFRQGRRETDHAQTRQRRAADGQQQNRQPEAAHQPS